MKTKRFLSVLLTLAMVIGTMSAFTINASAEEDIVCRIGEEYYSSISEALAVEHTDENYENPTVITLVADDTENVVIQDRNLVIDLDGYILNGGGQGTVLDIYADSEGHTVVLQDSNSGEQSHNFKVGSNGIWELTDETEGAVAYEALDKRPKAGTIVTVTGGAITNGVGAGGGGIINDNYSVLELQNVNVIGNQGYDENTEKTFGGGLCLCLATTYGNTSINGGIIAGNRANCGGGIHASQSLSLMDASVSFNYSEEVGGGLQAADLKAEVYNCKFIGNYAKDGGGGVDISESSYDVSPMANISDCEFIANSTDGDGGGISCTLTNIYDSTFENNEAAGNGGAIRCFHKNLILGSTITNNKAACGGGVYTGAPLSNGATVIICSTITDNTATENGGGVYVFKDSQCFLEGTKITMADGSLKNIEDVKEGDLVRTFDHEAGKLSSEKVCICFSGAGETRKVNMQFSDGTALDLIGEHDLFEKSARKYVKITPSNAKDYIGKSFYNANSGEWTRLISADVSKGNYNYYAIVTEHHLNCLANDMLTVVDQAGMLLNIYEMDESLKADSQKLSDDIKKFGIRDISDCFGATENLYDIFNMKYFNIVVGKELKNDEQLKELFDFACSEMVKDELMQDNKDNIGFMLMAKIDEFDDYQMENVEVTVGLDVTISGNKVGKVENNMYLMDGGIIGILNEDEFSNVNIGVTCETGAAKISENGTIEDSLMFSSDSKYYKVHYNTEGYIELIDIPHFVNSKDSGYYAETKDASEQEGIIAFTSLFENIDKFTFGANDKFGIAMFSTAEPGNVDKTSLDLTISKTNIDDLKTADGYFYSFIRNIAPANFGNNAYAIPFAVIDGETYWGDTVSAKVKDKDGNAKWLGTISNAPSEE